MLVIVSIVDIILSAYFEYWGSKNGLNKFTWSDLLVDIVLSVIPFVNIGTLIVLIVSIATKEDNMAMLARINTKKKRAKSKV